MAAGSGVHGTLKTGIIGYGYAGEVIHAPLIEHVPDLDLVAVSTARDERAAIARSRGYAVYPDAESLLADGSIDLVVIATPHDTHLTLTEAACAAGKHVVCDKLMALDVEQAGTMIGAAESAGVTLSVFHNRRWDGDYLAVAGAGEELGEPIQVRAWVYGAGRPGPGRWRSERAHGGGIFSDWGAHLMDQALLLHDSPVASVYCVMHHTVPEIDVETGAFCVIRFDDGSRHIIETSAQYHESSKGYEYWGADGRMVVTGFDPRENLLNQEVRGVARSAGGYSVTVYRDGAQESRPAPGPGAWADYYSNIAGHILRGEPLAVTPGSVFRMMRLREAALLSATEGRVVRGPI